MQTRSTFSSLRSWYLLSIFVLLTALSFSSCSSERTIVNGLEEKDANEILVFLASKNIEASKIPSKVGQGAGGAIKIQLWDIAVDPSRATEAMSILNSSGLPRRPGQSLLNIFSSGGLVPSEMQEKIRYNAGLEDQIATTIRKIDGVIDADVRLSFPEEDPLNPQAEKPKVVASVYVKHNGVLDDPNTQLVSKIKRLVSSSVQGLESDNVTVIGDKARFADVNIQPLKTTGQEKFDYVKVWSLVIAKESVTLFQIIFFIFCIIILLFALCFCWLGWKFYPILKKRGGIRALFHLTPLPDAYTTNKDEKPAEEELPKDDTKPKNQPPAPKIQENIESN
ncbi:MAG: sctJ-A [Chlamydiia bacterium]|nr:sctJ-A [Chlamydiia bacterium]